MYVCIPTGAASARVRASTGVARKGQTGINYMSTTITSTTNTTTATTISTIISSSRRIGINYMSTGVARKGDSRALGPVNDNHDNCDYDYCYIYIYV